MEGITKQDSPTFDLEYRVVSEEFLHAVRVVQVTCVRVCISNSLIHLLIVFFLCELWLNR